MIATQVREEQRIRLPVLEGLPAGDLVIPPRALGVMAFVHASGSGRRSGRDRAVARVLQRGGIGTFLFDLLSDDEERDSANVFDVELLTGRLARAVDVLGERCESAGLPLGLFGEGTGTAAALCLAARRPGAVRAIVSRGGRPDLARPWVPYVESPTLFVVGGRDTLVLELNQLAALRMQAPHRLVTVPGAGHLFEEPGALAQVAVLARDWATGWFTGHAGGS